MIENEKLLGNEVYVDTEFKENQSLPNIVLTLIMDEGNKVCEQIDLNPEMVKQLLYFLAKKGYCEWLEFFSHG